MTNPNAVLATVFRLDPPLDRPVEETLRTAYGLWVDVEGQRRLRLDPEDPRAGGFARVIDGLREQGIPAYIEFDPDTFAVTGVRVPYVSTVLGVRFVDQGVFDVVLAISHARHVLRESADDFATLRRRLDDAVRTNTPVILVDDDSHEIIDVLPVPSGFEVPGSTFPELPPRPPWPRRWFVDIWEILRRLWWWPWWPWAWLHCISRSHVQRVFEDMKSTSCAPLTVSPPCIPFLYPDDGCWGRASEMCRLMLLQGLRPRKVWIQGSLHVATRNNPTCGVNWGWHVAPTLCVRGRRCWQRERVVVDPSLFGTPVTRDQWKGIQGDPLATLTETDASVFHLFYPPHSTDPTYARTNQVLATYRLALQSRSVSQGPPPYANCP